jgi:hypothetical protein
LTPQEIREALAQVEAEIREVERRLPAHSAKPPIMQALFELEDRRDALLKALAAAEEKPPPA